MANDDPLSAWIALPRRIYLDTSILQTTYDHNDVIFDGVPFEPVGKAARVQGLSEEIDALREIYEVNQRAGLSSW